MSSLICNGDGTCIKECYCECVNKDTGEYEEKCTCGHRHHKGFCYSICCFPVKCRNYKYCNEKVPKWILDSYNGMSANCAIQLGRHEVTNITNNCPVCLEDCKMIVLKCNHLICNDCWYQICNKDCFYENTDEIYIPLCPLCRNKNDWSC
jgi:hypothetical protein